MAIVALIPGLLCLIAIVRGGTAHAFRVVVLPTLLLLPAYFNYTLRPIPPIGFAESALLVLGVGMFLHDLPRWRFSRSDVWMAVYLFSVAYGDRLMGNVSDSWLTLFQALLACLVPYMAGKLLIEQTGCRADVVKMFVWLLTGSMAFSAVEYFARKNVYTAIFNRFFPAQWWWYPTQVRWGFGRVAGPFAQSEVAGSVVLCGLMLALWVGRQNFEEKAHGRPAPLRRGWLHLLVIGVLLFMTQARGPWIGTVIALPLAWIGLSRRPGMRAAVTITLMLAIGVPAYLQGKDYAAGPRRNFGSERETAQYRRELIDNYIPVAQAGGPWGWGSNFPQVGGQGSIDNDYLLTWLIQGWVGVTVFGLLFVEAVLALALQAVRARTARDRHFALTMMAIMVGLAFVLATVALLEQMHEVLFLLFGWSQAVRYAAMRKPAAAVEDILLPRHATAPALRVYS